MTQVAQIFEEEKQQALLQVTQIFEEQKKQALAQVIQNFEEEKQQALTQAQQVYEEKQRQIVIRMIKKDYSTEEITSLVSSYSQDDVEMLRSEIAGK